MNGRGCNGRKQVFAQLHRDHSITQAEQGLTVCKDCFSRKLHHGTFRCSRKPPAFTGFTVVRQEALGNQSLQFAAGDHRCAVQKLMAGTGRQSYHRGQLRIFRCAIQDLLQALFSCTEQCVLIKQVGTAVAGQRQLRKQNHIRILLICLLQISADILGVFLYIGYLHLGYGTGNTNIIQHRISSRFYFSYHNTQCPFCKENIKGVPQKTAAHLYISLWY